MIHPYWGKRIDPDAPDNPIPLSPYGGLSLNHIVTYGLFDFHTLEPICHCVIDSARQPMCQPAIYFTPIEGQDRLVILTDSHRHLGEFKDKLIWAGLEEIEEQSYVGLGQFYDLNDSGCPFPLRRSGGFTLNSLCTLCFFDWVTLEPLCFTQVDQIRRPKMFPALCFALGDEYGPKPVILHNNPDKAREFKTRIIQEGLNG